LPDGSLPAQILDVAMFGSCIRLLASSFRGPCPACARRRGAPLCGECSSASRVTGLPISLRPGHPPLHFVGAYHAGGSAGSRGLSPLGRSLRRFKDSGDRYAGRCLASLFAGVFAPLAADFDVVVAVPADRERLQRRGYSPAGWLASALARAGKLPVDASTLRHVAGRPSQRGLDGETRRANARGAIRLGRPGVGGYAVLLVDDVCTTGATLTDATRCLLEAGSARVECAVLACADDDLLPKCPSTIDDAGNTDTVTRLR
jgi:ComF family protein